MTLPSLAVRPTARSIVKTISTEAAQRRFMTVVAVGYIHLWILEGAMRKWIPPLEGPMYLARDVLLMLAFGLCYLLYGRFEQRRRAVPIFWAYVLGLSAFVLVQVLVLEIPPAIAAIGLRSYLSPFLFLYVAVRTLGPDFTARATRILLVYAPFELALAMVQVSQPTTAPINSEVGGDATILTTSDGIVRASATFSAPNGLIGFQSLVIAVCLAALFGRTQVNRALVWVALGSTLVGVAIGGSRSSVFTVAIILGAVVLRSLATPRARSVAMIAAVLAAAGVIFVLAQALFPAVLEAFFTRFTVASQQENTVLRVLDSTFGFLSSATSLLGDGAGMRSSPGVALGSGMTWVETDTLRWSAELGVVGTLMASTRLLIGFGVALWVVRNVRRLSFEVVAIFAVLLPLLFAGTIAGSAPADQAAFSIGAALLVLAPRWATDRAPSRPRPIV